MSDAKKPPVDVASWWANTPDEALEDDIDPAAPDAANAFKKKPKRAAPKREDVASR